MGPRALPVRASGFTLLEMVVVLAIMALMIGLGVASFQFFDDTSEFDEPSARLAEMAKFSLHAAMIRQRGLIIAFDEDGFGVVGEGGGPGSRYNLPGKMRLKVLRWGGRNWEKADGQIWQFGSQGICEPIQVRLESAKGAHEIAFHPLTGAPIVQP